MWQLCGMFHNQIFMIRETRNALSDVRGPHEYIYAEHTRNMTEYKSDKPSGM